jgi:hypothetical protein
VTRGRRKFKVVEQDGYGKEEVAEGDTLAELARKLGEKAGLDVGDDDA